MSIVNGVWFGKRPLSNIQKLCIQSYQYYGHSFVLWTSDEPASPSGTNMRNVYDVLPYRVPPFTGENYFSDYFRVVLIHQIGGIYVDLDTCCLGDFSVLDNYAFVSESRLGPMKALGSKLEPSSNQVQEYLSGCIFKAPAGDPMLKYIVERIEGMDTLHPTNWICMGPELFQEAIPKFGRQKYVKPPSVFDAYNYDQLEMFVTEDSKDWTPPPEALAIHLRTSFWQEKYHPILKPNGVFSESSLYEILKKRYGVKNE